MVNNSTQEMQPDQFVALIIPEKEVLNVIGHAHM